MEAIIMGFVVITILVADTNSAIKPRPSANAGN